MSKDCRWPKYPRAWKRISRTIRRLANGRCERCGQSSEQLSVHHLGVPYADGTPGNPEDKHDIRRENLICTCLACHESYEPITRISARRRLKKARRRAKLEAHQALGIGTGLVPCFPGYLDFLAR